MHGIKVLELLAGGRPLPDIATSVIGMVAIAEDADDDVFPLNKPVLVTNFPTAIEAAGADGTLAKALQAIADQTNAIVVVVRVAEGTGQNAQTATDTNVIGGVTAGAYTGLKALLAAEAQLGVRPRIIGCPGLDTTAVVAAMIPIAQQLRGMAYAMASGATVAAAVTNAGTYEARELKLHWPETTGGAGDLIARVLGARARTDQEQGWHKTLSNVAINGITGLSKDVFFDLQSDTTDAAVLNAANITTIVNMNGYRAWGNRTCADEPLYAFESTVRTAQVLKDACAEGLAWAVDKPLNAGLIRDIIETINADIRGKVAAGRLIGGKAWFDPAKNGQVALAGGQLKISFNYTPVAPAEGITIEQILTDEYYGTIGASV